MGFSLIPSETPIPYLRQGQGEVYKDLYFRGYEFVEEEKCLSKIVQKCQKRV
jgi:hypothetical protein